MTTSAGVGAPDVNTAGTAGPGRALKARHREMWALGDYPAVACDLIPDLGAVLVGACGVRPGDRVLDVASGPGNAAIPAALAGASVVACDLTPHLLECGRREAVRRGAEAAWREGDAEALPFADGEFDTVLSCLGVMFAPDHEASAAELARVCRPGGTIGLLNWTPEGFVGQMLATMKPYLPPPPPGTKPAPLWGTADHVRSLLAGRASEVTSQRQTVRVDRFATPEAFRDYFKASYGPTIAAYRGIAHDPGRVAAPARGWRTWPGVTARAGSWSGSTCCSPTAARAEPAVCLLSSARLGRRRDHLGAGCGLAPGVTSTGR